MEENESMSPGTQRIAIERLRQVEKKDYDERHDDEHDKGELAIAAACYAFSAARSRRHKSLVAERIYVMRTYAATVHYDDPWPWEERFDTRPYDGNVLKEPTDDEAIRLLEKAGALIAAEIDRLLRAQADPSKKKIRGG